MMLHMMLVTIEHTVDDYHENARDSDDSDICTGQEKEDDQMMDLVERKLIRILIVRLLSLLSNPEITVLVHWACENLQLINVKKQQQQKKLKKKR